MTKKFIGIVITFIVFISIGFYLVVKQQKPSITITNFDECAQAGNPVGESYPRQCWTPDGKHFVEESGPITISGEITCLPKNGQGEQTLECAIGLKTADGQHYGLKNLFKFDPEYNFSVNGKHVEVTGILNSEEMKGPDGNNYAIAGTIDITSIKEVNEN